MRQVVYLFIYLTVGEENVIEVTDKIWQMSHRFRMTKYSLQILQNMTSVTEIPHTS